MKQKQIQIKRSYKDVMSDLMESFKGGDLPEAVARTYIQFPDVPCTKYSIVNRLLILFAQTSDARGYRQWESVGRHVCKGSKAFYIFVPKIVRDKDEDGMENSRCTGFVMIPMFRYEDTEGDPLPEHTPATIPPLMDVAEKAGIRVTWGRSSHGEYGYFCPGTNSIGLSSEDPKTFFHELVHAYDNQAAKLKGGQDPVQECVAEFGACVLARVFGIPVDKWSYDYIGSYNDDVPNMCQKVLTRVDGIVRRILADHATA